jgi:hypothetical protein
MRDRAAAWPPSPPHQPRPATDWADRAIAALERPVATAHLLQGAPTRGCGSPREWGGHNYAVPLEYLTDADHTADASDRPGTPRALFTRARCAAPPQSASLPGWRSAHMSPCWVLMRTVLVIQGYSLTGSLSLL